MAMRQSINTALRGYLDLFRLRTGGANPQVVAEFMQPIIDLQRWYLESVALSFNWSVAPIVAPSSAVEIPITATAFTNISNGVNVIVPQSEMWILMPGTFIQAELTTGAGTQTAKVGYQLININGHASSRIRVPIDVTEGWDTSVVGPSRQFARVLSAPFFIPPGLMLQGYQFGITASGGGQVDISGGLRLVRLKA